MNIGRFNFSDPAPISFFAQVPTSAVYVVMTHDFKFWHHLYVGQSENLANRFSRHEKWNKWQKYQMRGGLHFVFLHIAESKVRLSVETELRRTLIGLPCNQQ